MSKTVVIVGNGISGITAARHIRKNCDARIIVIGAESDHFYARTALMYIYMGHMGYEQTKPYEDWFWSKNRIELIRATAETIDTERKTVGISSGKQIAYDDLILATGSQSNRPPWKGADLPGVQTLYGLSDLEQLESNSAHVRHAVIVGGGLIGIELAEMMRSREIGVTFLVREQSYMDHLLPSEESDLVNREIRDHGIDLHLGTELDQIDPGTDGRVASVLTNDGQRIECGLVGISVGVNPNADLAKQSGISASRGILVDECFRTSADSVYAIGDCAEFNRSGIGHRSVEQLWYSGRRHGETVAQTISGNESRYERGIFYNSAKFFNLEYQTYGEVPAKDSEATGSIVLCNELKRKLIRVSFQRATGRVVGFNVVGVRFRQDQCHYRL